MTLAIQRGLYQVLSPLGFTIYDAAPQKVDGGNAAAFPYVEIGAIVVSEFDTASETGFDFVARIHTRSRSAGMAECKTIQDQVYGRLHRKTFSVDGANLILMQRETSDCNRMADGSFHGICEYRGLVEVQ